jgi:hypothetical protein
MSNIPPHIIETINTLLAPFGAAFTPGASAPSRYMNYRGAAKYTGLSVSTLRRAVESGDLTPPLRPKVGGSPGRAALFSSSQLDDYLHGR